LVGRAWEKRRNLGGGETGKGMLPFFHGVYWGLASGGKEKITRGILQDCAVAFSPLVLHDEPKEKVQGETIECTSSLTDNSIEHLGGGATEMHRGTVMLSEGMA